MTVRGVLLGGVGLTVLYNLSTSTQKGLGTATSLPGRLAHYIVSPDVPLIPDLRGTPGSGAADLANGAGSLGHVPLFGPDSASAGGAAATPPALGQITPSSGSSGTVLD